jgi:hypothetical protein
MATPQYDPLYAAFLSAYGIEDDTKPVVDPDLVKEWRRASADVAAYRSKRDVAALRERQADRTARLGYIKSSRDYQAKLEETAGKDRRVSAQVFTERMNNLTTNRTRLATQRSQYQDRAFQPAKNAFQGKTDTSGAAESAEILLRTLQADERGIGYRPDQPDVAGLGEQWVQMVLKKDLAKATPQEVAEAVKQAGGSSELQVGMAGFIQEAQQADAAVRGANAEIDSAIDEVNRLGAGGSLEGETKEQALRAAKRAQSAFETLVGRDPEAIQADLEAMAAEDSEYQRLLEREEDFKSLAVKPGKEGLHSRKGRIVSNPSFRAWAADNGFALGESMVDADGSVTYVEGPDDAKALARFAYQLENPGKQGPFLRGSRKTGEMVRVTATDPAERARLMQAYDLGGGQYALSNDEKTLLTPVEFQKQLNEAGAAPQGFQVAQDANATYIKTPEGIYFSVAPDGKKTQLSSAPAGLAFEDAVVYDEAGKPFAYMTQADFDSNLVGADGVPIFGNADDNDRKAIEAKMPVRVVGADEVAGLGNVQFMGYRDRLNARDMTQYGTGAFSINNGAHKFTSGSTYEVMEKPAADRPSGRLERKALKRMEELNLQGLTPEQLRTAQAPAKPEVEAPVRAVQPTALSISAALGPAAEARGEMLQRGGLASPAETATAEGLVARAEARRQAEQAAAAAPQVSAESADIFGTAPAEVTTETAAPERTSFYQTPDGAVYRVIEGVGATMVAPAPGKVMPADPAARKIAEGTPEYDAFVDSIMAPGSTGRNISEKEAAAYGTKDLEVEPLGAPTPEVTDFLGSKRIDYGRERPTFLQQARTKLGEVADAARGLIPEAREPGEDRRGALRRALGRGDKGYKEEEARRVVDEKAAKAEQSRRKSEAPGTVGAPVGTAPTKAEMLMDAERMFKPGSETTPRPRIDVRPETPFEVQAFKVGVGSPRGETLGRPSTYEPGGPAAAVPFPQGRGMTPVQQRGGSLRSTPAPVRPFVGEGALPAGGLVKAEAEKAQVDQYTKTGEKIPTPAPRAEANATTPPPKFGMPGFLSKQMAGAVAVDKQAKGNLANFKKAQKAGAKKTAAEDEDIFGGQTGTITMER